MTSNIRPALKVHTDGREVCDLDHKAGKKLYLERTHAMAERQNWRCGLCGKTLYGWKISFDHEHGRGMGGAKRDDRIEVDGVRHNAAVHIHCNNEKGSRMVPYVVQ